MRALELRLVCVRSQLLESTMVVSISRPRKRSHLLGGTKIQKISRPWKESHLVGGGQVLLMMRRSRLVTAKALRSSRRLLSWKQGHLLVGARVLPISSPCPRHLALVADGQRLSIDYFEFGYMSRPMVRAKWNLVKKS